MSEQENRLCLRCLLLALLPILAAGGLGWWANAAFDQREQQTEIELAAIIEEAEDLRLQTTDLEGELIETRDQLEAAKRAAASSGPVTTGEIRDRIAALNEVDRETLLTALGVGDAFGADAIGEAIAAAPATEQDRLFDRLPDFDAFSGWFAAQPADRKAEWLGRLPEAQDLTITKVDLPELGLVDVATISQQFSLLQDQSDQVIAERDELRTALEVVQTERDAYEAEKAELAGELEQLKSQMAAQPEAPGLATMADAFSTLSEAERVAFLGDVAETGAIDAWVGGLDDGARAAFAERLGLAGASAEDPAAAEDPGLRNQLDQLIGDLATATAERDSLRAEVATLRGAEDTPDAERLALPGRGVVTVAEAQQAFSELDGVLADLRSAVESARVSISQKEARIAALEEELAQAQSTAEQAQAEAEKTRAALVGRLRDKVETAENGSENATGGAEIGTPVTLNANVAFGSGSATLSEQGQETLARMAEELLSELEARPSEEWELVIEGHTDRRPIFTERYRSNWDLSAARAAAVARYLATLGVPEERLVAVGRAEFAPVDLGESEAAYARNRRIEFDIRSRQ